jgi:DNA-binding transcriptional LysR family regulator
MTTASFQGFACFAETAKHASFARAARTLGLSPSAVAKSVARLEAALGVRLFHRTTRQVTLTGDGHELFERCQRVLEEIEGLRSAAEGTRRAPRGRLLLDVPVTYGKQAVVPVLARLAVTYPELSIDVRFSDRFVDLIQDGLDAVVRVGALGDSRLVARPFDQQQLLVCASPRYLKRKGTPATLADIAAHECVGIRNYLSGRERLWQLRQGGKDIEILPRSRVIFDDGEAAVRGVVAGLGLIQLPDYYFELALREERVVEVLARFRPPPMPISVVYPSKRQIPQRLRVLIDALAEARDGA